ncbi:MAG: acetyl/propionyl/methylcrotonyl-CoA carboxylase subunit alpha [Thermoplasmata archaeon]
MFRKVLVANRGEIALRVMRACREMSISTVAVFSIADRKSLHRAYADEAFEIGGEDPSESYLNADRLLRVAKRSGAEAVHPGYGFLAENSEFVKRCEEEGLVFIGPDSRAMALAGDKLQSKRVLEDAGIEVSPGSNRAVKDADDAIGVAEKVGYPIILKISGGGGGIGMEIVEGPEQMEGALTRARSLALSAFGVSDVFLEKYHRGARHIEFQILSDGNRTIHLGERECSIQRRYQKLVEEAPSPAVTEEVREEMGRLSIKAAEALGYVNAGTIEYVYSGERFYFNEVNARLQVEHPVTEMVTGLDIVREQIAIAAEEGLSLDQEDLDIRGWALECRINAEDPFRGFLPSPGRVTDMSLPGGPGVRVDTALREGQLISAAYDPLVAKVITHGGDRTQATHRMRRALDEIMIKGIRVNVPLHQAIIRNQAFLRGDLSTSFLSDMKIDEALATMREKGEERQRELVVALAAAVAVSEGALPWRTETFVTQRRMPGAWSLAGREALQRLRLTYGHEVRRIA